MNLLREYKNRGKKSDPKGGLCDVLRSNKIPPHCPPLGFISQTPVTEDDLLDYLANIIVESALEKHYDEKPTT